MKRFYVVLFSVLCISVVLLGFSFSKESGSNELSFLNDEETKEYRVIYSNGNVLNTNNNSSTVISLINRSSEKRDIIVNLKEKDNLNYKNVFYKIDGGPEHLLVDSNIKLGILNAYGDAGDHQTFNLQVYTKDKTEYNFKINIGTSDNEDNKSIYNIVKNSENIYSDKKGNIRYYGENVNNYILYKGEKHRIIGIIDNKVKIISAIHGLGYYNTTLREYATLEDYLGSYNNSNVNIGNVLNYKSWINDRGFWLKDEVDDEAYYASMTNGIGLYQKNAYFYLRYVDYLDSKYIVVDGDGSVNNPYEVSYGS